VLEISARVDAAETRLGRKRASFFSGFDASPLVFWLGHEDRVRRQWSWRIRSRSDRLFLGKNGVAVDALEPHPLPFFKLLEVIALPFHELGVITDAKAMLAIGASMSNFEAREAY